MLTSKINADNTNSLSAIGSSSLPSFVTWPVRRAMYPSNRSVIAATTKTNAALNERSGVGVKNSITNTGISKIRTSVMKLGKFKDSCPTAFHASRTRFMAM